MSTLVAKYNNIKMNALKNKICKEPWFSEQKLLHLSTGKKKAPYDLLYRTKRPSKQAQKSQH
jgi:hypothetical protein